MINEAPKPGETRQYHMALVRHSEQEDYSIAELWLRWAIKYDRVSRLPDVLYGTAGKGGNIVHMQVSFSPDADPSAVKLLDVILQDFFGAKVEQNCDTCKTRNPIASE